MTRRFDAFVRESHNLGCEENDEHESIISDKPLGSKQKVNSVDLMHVRFVAGLGSEPTAKDMSHMTNFNSVLP